MEGMESQRGIRRVVYLGVEVDIDQGAPHTEPPTQLPDLAALRLSPSRFCAEGGERL